MNSEDLSLIDAAAAIRDGSLSSVDYVQALLARIGRIEQRICSRRGRAHVCRSDRFSDHWFGGKAGCLLWHRVFNATAEADQSEECISAGMVSRSCWNVRPVCCGPGVDVRCHG